MWLPYETDITATDRVLVDGVEWRVATVKRLRWGSVAHTEATVERSDAGPA